MCLQTSNSSDSRFTLLGIDCSWNSIFGSVSFNLCSYLLISAATNSETGEEVAIKKIGNAFDNIIDAKRTLREIKLLKHMDHENVRDSNLISGFVL